MIASFFEKTSPFSTITVFLILFLLSFLISFQEYGIQLESIKKGFYLFLPISISLYILLFTVKNQKLTLKNNYSAILFVLIVFSLFNNLNINFNILSILPLSFALFKIYGLHNHNTAIQKSIFNSSFWIGLATLFEPWNTLFLLLLLIAVFTYNTNTLKNIATSLLGWITPLFLAFTYVYCFTEISFKDYLLPKNIDFSLNYLISTHNIIPTVFIGIFILISLLFIGPKAVSIGKKFIANWKILFSHFLIAVIVNGYTSEKTIFNALLLAFPLSIIFGILLQNIKKPMIKNGILWLFIMMVALQIIW